MSSFEVDYSKLRTRSLDIATIYKAINSLKQQLNNCNNALKYCLPAGSYESIKKSLSANSDSLQQQISHLNSLSSGLSQISSTYLNTEKTIKSGDSVFKGSQITDFLKNLLNGGSLNNSLVSGYLSGSTSLLGIITSGSISGSLLGYDLEGTNKWKFERDKNGKFTNLSAELGGNASVYGAKGKAEGKFGLLSGSVEGSLLNAGASGAIGATLFKDGKFSPSISAEIKGKANVAEGELKTQFGTDDYNAHMKASGEFLGASAEASGKAGIITYKDAAGNNVTAAGVQGKVGAEAYVAQGSVSGGFSIFGVKIDASVTGKAGGAGVSASGQATTNGVSGSIGAGLGIGAGLTLSVDWSGAVDNITKNWDDISSSISKGWNSIADGVSKLKFW